MHELEEWLPLPHINLFLTRSTPPSFPPEVCGRFHPDYMTDSISATMCCFFPPRWQRLHTRRARKDAAALLMMFRLFGTLICKMVRFSLRDED